MKVKLRNIVLAWMLPAVMSGNIYALDQDMVRFAATKETQTRELAGAQTNKVPSYIWSFFDAVRVDDWETASILSERISTASGRYSLTNEEFISPALRTAIWPPISETIGAYDQFHDWDNKWLHWFGSNVIASIPQGSIYFGGTDPGRFVISALSESHRDGKPFFTLTQNQLADGAYLDYLRTMYGSKLYIPSADDSRKVFEEYRAGARRRMASGKLKPGEDVTVTEDGRIRVSGQVAVMEINGLLAKLILEKNPTREFYVEESFTLDWMYPYLSPHGLIMLLHHEPLKGLREETVQKDLDDWKRFTGEMIGDWITSDTPLKEICDFADRVYLQKNLDGFKGDKAFAQNKEVQKCLSKLRSSIGGLYVWFADHAGEDSKKIRLRQAADLAFRQAFALCPYSPEAVFRYCNLLIQLKRPDDAIMVAKVAMRLDTDNSAFQNLLQSLRKSY